MTQKETREEMMARLMREHEQKVAEWKEYLCSKQDYDFLDEDGYPTEDALDLITKWHWIDEKGWFEFIHSIWHLASWGWREGGEPHDWKDAKVYRYNISTGGWSGNESIIRAMQKNEMLWHLTWVQSRRGGHYIFELQELVDDEIQ